jgi:hypothetical protein
MWVTATIDHAKIIPLNGNVNQNKIIFLDVDGVLNCQSSWKRFPEKHSYQVDPEKVERLRRVCDITGAKIVLSSSWRTCDCHYATVSHFIHDLYVKGLPHITKMHMGSGFRGMEIADWLEDNGKGVDRYVIIDDNSDMTDEQLEHHFVQTDFDINDGGLQEDHVNQLISILGAKDESVSEGPLPTPLG